MTGLPTAVARTAPDRHAVRPCLERLNADMTAPARRATQSNTERGPGERGGAALAVNPIPLSRCQDRRAVSSLPWARYESAGQPARRRARGAARMRRASSQGMPGRLRGSVSPCRSHARVSGPRSRGTSGRCERRRTPPRRRRARGSFRPCRWTPRHGSGGSTSSPDPGSRRKLCAAGCKIPARALPRQLYPSPTFRSTAPLSHVANQHGCYKRDSVKSS